MKIRQLAIPLILSVLGLHCSNKNTVSEAFIFDNALAYDNGFATVNKSNRWGCIDVKGNLVVPFKYKNNFQFREGLALVKNDANLFGFIDTVGNEVVDFRYEAAKNFPALAGVFHLPI